MVDDLPGNITGQREEPRALLIVVGFRGGDALVDGAGVAALKDVEGSVEAKEEGALEHQGGTVALEALVVEALPALAQGEASGDVGDVEAQVDEE